jgi:hypothetical protein
MLTGTRTFAASASFADAWVALKTASKNNAEMMEEILRNITSPLILDVYFTRIPFFPSCLGRF